MRIKDIDNILKDIFGAGAINIDYDKIHNKGYKEYLLYNLPLTLTQLAQLEVYRRHYLEFNIKVEIYPYNDDILLLCVYWSE